MKRVAVLFAKVNSPYLAFELADVYDEKRNALTFPGGLPVVAHPPCRAWGKLRHLSRHQSSERLLAHFAVSAVRRNGGVLEHPAHSTLWPAAGLPRPGVRDSFGGITIPIMQSWFGHRAPKATWLYMVGGEIPVPAFDLGYPTGRIEFMGRAERERTPLELATWLLDLADGCSGFRSPGSL